MGSSTLTVGTVTVLIIDEKRFDATVADQYKARILELVHAGQARLCLDLAGVEFIDSSGLNALIAGTRSAREKAGALKVACPTIRVKEMFQLTRVDRMIPVFDTRDAAVSSFG